MERLTSRLWLWLAGRRRWVQVASTLLINSYVTQNVTKGIPCPAFNCYACPAASFACPIGTIQHFMGRRRAPLYVMGIVGLVGALIGRGSCGWLCPFGLLQDLMYKMPVPKLRLPNRFNWTRYVFLAVLVVIIPFLVSEPWFCKLCPAGTLEGGIPVLLFEQPSLRVQIGLLFWVKIAILVVFLAWMSVTRRPFCRWACPLGAMWSPFNRASTIRLSVDEASCLECDHCQQMCPMNLKAHEEIDSSVCIRCMTCVEACPVGAISVHPLYWDLAAETDSGRME
jgi:polyferredoxin